MMGACLSFQTVQGKNDRQHPIVYERYYGSSADPDVGAIGHKNPMATKKKLSKKQ